MLRFMGFFEIYKDLYRDFFDYLRYFKVYHWKISFINTPRNSVSFLSFHSFRIFLNLEIHLEIQYHFYHFILFASFWTLKTRVSFLIAFLKNTPTFPSIAVSIVLHRQIKIVQMHNSYNATRFSSRYNPRFFRDLWNL